MIQKHLWETINSLMGKYPHLNERIRYESVAQLSAGFTTERTDLSGDYLSTDSELLAYVTYFLPLNFLKIDRILQGHSSAWMNAVDAKAVSGEVIKMADFGCGPGTASLAFLDVLKNKIRNNFDKLKVEIHLIEPQEKARSVAKILVLEFAKKLRIPVTVHEHAELPKAEIFDFSFALNVLNELPQTNQDLEKLWEQTTGYFLMLEPSHRVSSQRLIRFRERILKKENTSMVGPCTHSDKCPLYRTNNWCHFSEPAGDNDLERLSLRIFSNPRKWLKFSYLFLHRKPKAEWDGVSFRAIGDMHPVQGRNLAIDLCKPGEKQMLLFERPPSEGLMKKLVRGAHIQLKSDKEIIANPLTKIK